MSMYHPYSRPPERSIGLYVWPLVLLLGAALFLVWRFWPARPAELNPNAQPRAVAPAGNLFEAENASIALYLKTAPSVVNVTSLAVMRDRFSLNLQQIRKGMGSGFIWDREGHIVTNNHVIEGANAIQVTLADHSTWKVQRKAADPKMDLAVLWIGAPSSRLSPITVGDSHSLKVGQYAFAIGNPFGLDQSLAMGCVSALGREITEDDGRTIKGVIQTTAPINPGNSGGPLLDSSGRLIGVNTAILSPSGAWAGIGFAIPVDEVNRVVTQLIRKGEIIPAGLGVELAPDQVARRLGLSGVLILNVYQNGAGAKAGLRPTRRTEDGIELGDVILEIDDTPVRTGKQFHAVLDRHAVGDVVQLGILRHTEDGETQRLSVKATLQEDTR